MTCENCEKLKERLVEVESELDEAQTIIEGVEGERDSLEEELILRDKEKEIVSGHKKLLIAIYEKKRNGLSYDKELDELIYEVTGRI